MEPECTVDKPAFDILQLVDELDQAAEEEQRKKSTSLSTRFKSS
jgi:hypothetical protein